MERTKEAKVVKVCKILHQHIYMYFYTTCPPENIGTPTNGVRNKVARRRPAQRHSGNRFDDMFICIKQLNERLFILSVFFG